VADSRQSGKRPKASAARGSGPSIEKAVDRAMAGLGFAPGELDENQYDLRVLTEPEEGFLGVGGVDAEVEIILREDALEALSGVSAGDEEETLGDEDDWQPSAGSDRLREYLDTILRHLGIDARVTIEETADALRAEITGEELGILIGRRGQTLDAIEHLASIILYPNPDARKELEIDAEGYKGRRRAGIERVAERKAQEAVKRRRSVELESMTPAERKIVHLTLRDWEGVSTESVGREPNRYVVIHPSR